MVKYDTSYANYLRLCAQLLIPPERQMVNLDWNWFADKEAEIARLMNLAEVRDQPENGSEAAW
jgi:hypothetical protein